MATSQFTRSHVFPARCRVAATRGNVIYVMFRFQPRPAAAVAQVRQALHPYFRVEE